MLNVLQANPSPAAKARPKATPTQDSMGAIGFLPGLAPGTLRGRVELLLEATSLQAAVLELIYEARTSIKCDIDLLRGREGQALAKALAHRARAGVRVQILAHGAPSHGLNARIADVRSLGLVVRRGAVGGQNAAGKLIVADDRVAMVGAMGDLRIAHARRGLLKLAGEVAWELGRQFNHDWVAAGGNPVPLADPATMVLTASGVALTVGGVGPARKAARAVVLTALRRAKASVEVMVDLLDDADTLKALIDAHVRGVDVRVLLGESATGADEALTRLGIDPRAAAIQTLDTAGVPVRILMMSGATGTMGIRAAVIDGDTLVMGSLAFTRQSFAGAGEVVVEARGTESAAILRALFESDWELATSARRPTPARRVMAIVAPALRALSHTVSAAQQFAFPDVRMGFVKMNGAWRLVTDVR